MDKDAGTWGRDEARNIVGQIGIVAHGGGNGAFYGTHYTASRIAASTGGFESYTSVMDISRVVPTGPQNVPLHVWQPLIISLGRSAQV